MIYDIVPHGGTAAELLGSWQFVLGALVLTVGPAIAVRRHRVALAALSDDDRTAAADRRGRRIEDVLTVVIATAAAALSATGLRRVGRHQMGLTDPFDLLPFVALDVAAMVCGRRARRRARAGEGPGLSGALFWILAGISAVFSASEASSPLGSAVRAVWPVLAAVLWEIGSLEERRAARAGRGRPDRRIALVRLFHPVEAFRVGRAAYRWYRLRRAQEAVKHAGGMTRWAYRLAEIHADTRAQRASERAGCSDTHVLEQVVARLQMRVLQTDMAGMNLRTTKAFDQLRGTLIGTIPAIPQHHSAPHPPCPSHPDGEKNPQVTDGMGGEEDTPDTGDDLNDTGPNPSQDAPRDAPAPVQHKTDDEVMAAFIATVPREDDGTFAWGINKCASALGIGNPRARRFLETQHEWLPEALAHAAADGDATADGPDHFDEAVAVGNGLQPADVVRPLLLPTHTAAAEQQLLDDLLDPAAGDGYAQLGNGLLVPAGARQP
ncbi:DUF2637 domain-containing protein [Streptomyces sp. NPDC002519]